jgi:hypothetical protein
LYLALWIIVQLEGKAEAEPSLGRRVRQATDEAKQAAKKFKDEVTKR